MRHDTTARAVSFLEEHRRDAERFLRQARLRGMKQPVAPNALGIGRVGMNQPVATVSTGWARLTPGEVEMAAKITPPAGALPPTPGPAANFPPPPAGLAIPPQA